MQSELIIYRKVGLFLLALTCSEANVSRESITVSPTDLHIDTRIVGSAFSPDSNDLVVVTHVLSSASELQDKIQIIKLNSDQKVVKVNVVSGYDTELGSAPHYVAYSSDGRYLLLATKSSDIVLIIEVDSLQVVSRIALHPDLDSRRILGRPHRFFRGVVSVATADDSDRFALLTHDEERDNEVFIGSFRERKIVNKWSLGVGRASTETGQISISLSADGSKLAVSALPQGDSFPKEFHNLRLYDVATGQLLKAIHTIGFLGPVSIISANGVLGARIDQPGLFAKNTCIEEWNWTSGTLSRQFCDSGLNVGSSMAVSVSAGRVVGFSAKTRKSIEGHIYSIKGKIDVWDLKSGSLLSSSPEIPSLISHLELSPSGEWLIGDRSLFRLVA